MTSQLLFLDALERGEIERHSSVSSNVIRRRRTQCDGLSITSELELCVDAVALRIEGIGLVDELHGVGVRWHIEWQWVFVHRSRRVSSNEAGKYGELLLVQSVVLALRIGLAFERRWLRSA